MRLRRWFRCEFWVWILFLIRNTEFMCCRIQICAQHGSHNENFPQKVAPKFNWALSGGSYSRLTFWVRRRTCLGVPPIFAFLTRWFSTKGIWRRGGGYPLNRKNPLSSIWRLPNGRLKKTWQFLPLKDLACCHFRAKFGHQTNPTINARATRRMLLLNCILNNIKKTKQILQLLSC